MKDFCIYWSWWNTQNDATVTSGFTTRGPQNLFRRIYNLCVASTRRCTSHRRFHPRCRTYSPKRSYVRMKHLIYFQSALTVTETNSPITNIMAKLESVGVIELNRNSIKNVSIKSLWYTNLKLREFKAVPYYHIYICEIYTSILNYHLLNIRYAKCFT
jgi:hypothetical protein